MALPVYSYSSIPTDSEFNAFLRPTFVVDEAGEEFPGQLHRLRDDSLSNDATQIKGRTTTFFDALKVVAGSGLGVAYQGGQVTLETGLVSTIAPGVLTLPNNAVTYVFLNSSGVVTQSATIPSRWFPMARVTTSGGVVTLVEDLRERFKILPVSRAIAAFGSGGYEGNLIISANTTLNGTRYVNNFTIDVGATVTVAGGLLFVKASGNVTINGIINVAAVVSPGAGFGGSIVGPYIFFGIPGAGLGRSPGHNIVASPAYPYQASGGLGSSGSAGLVVLQSGASADMATANGGAGGGAIFIEAAGTITINGTINANGEAATIGSITNLSPGTAQAYATGASGGTGGTILLASLTSIAVNLGATLSARGGNSSAAVRSASATQAIAGAGGSSGGYIVLQSPTLSVNGGATLNVTGGNGGTGIAGTGGYGSMAGSSFAAQGGAFGAGSAAGSVGGTGQIIQSAYAPI